MIEAGPLALKKGKMMKKASVWAVLLVILCVFVTGLSGCGQPGETAAEGHRRHKRYLRVSREQLMRDVDSFMMTDKPSALGNKRID